MFRFHNMAAATRVSKSPFSDRRTERGSPLGVGLMRMAMIDDGDDQDNVMVMLMLRLIMMMKYIL